MKFRSLVSVVAASVMMVFTASAKTESSQHPFLSFAKELGLQTVYSVDMNMNMMGMTMASKVYQDGTQSRFDSTIPFLNLKTSTIQTVKDAEPIAYVLFHASKKYVIQKSEGAADPEKAPEFTITDLGTEVYNGEKCTKKRIVTKGDESTVMDILFSPKQKNMPVKMTAGLNGAEKTAKEDGENVVVVMTFTDYVFKKPEAALFTVPADYTEAATAEEAMQGSGELFGMLGAMAAAGETAEAEDADDAKAREEAAENAAKAMEELSKAMEQAAKDSKDAAVKNATESAVEQGTKSLMKGLFGR